MPVLVLCIFHAGDVCSPPCRGQWEGAGCSEVQGEDKDRDSLMFQRDSWAGRVVPAAEISQCNWLSCVNCIKCS